MANRWTIVQNKEIGVSLPKACIPPQIAHILYNRGYDSLSSVLEFLRPSLFNLHSPYLFKDMEKIIRRLDRALKTSEKVLIYGDYDVDGITAAALLYKVLQNFGFNLLIHIPLREDGYGLHQEIIDRAAKNDVGLIITVDCGITACEEVERATSLGVDVIITDHHEPAPNLPAAVGILNPKVENSGYPFKHLAGVGVAFKLVQALFSHFGYGEKLSSTEWEYLDLVALGTIADVVPLIGENRILVKHGLGIMSNTDHVGLRALLTECGLEGKKLSAGQVSFMLAPRINAAGRMDTAQLALNLLLEEQFNEALIIAKELSKENYRRQEMEKEILSEAEKLLAQEPLPEIIVLSSPRWHHGVIGIVASRLVEKFERPVYLIAEEGPIGKGSARGIKGYHVLEELRKAQSLLQTFGGHKQAAGFSIKVANIDNLRTFLTQSYIESGFSYEPQLEIEAVVEKEELDLELGKELAQMAPFGIGNPAPLLLSTNLPRKSIHLIGKDKEHLKIILGTSGESFEVLAFRKGNEFENISTLDYLDIVYNLEINEFRQEIKLQAILKDYREALPEGQNQIACTTEERINEENTQKAEELENDFKVCSEAAPLTMGLNRPILVDFYKALKVQSDGQDVFFWRANDNFQFQLIKILEELGIVDWLGGTNPFLIRLNTDKKTDLKASLRFRVAEQNSL